MSSISESSKSAASDLKYMTSAISVVGAFFDNFKSKINSAFSTLLSNVKNTKSKLSDELLSIQKMFADTKLSFNSKIAVPHFALSGAFNAEKRTVPKVSVQWYKEAATQGAVFSSPTVIGVGDARQPEMLIGERTLYEKISEATGKQGDTIIPVYIGGDLIDTIVAKANKRSTYRSGGR